MQQNKDMGLDRIKEGFTLVEVMVSTALIFLIMSAVYTVSDTTFRIFEKEVKIELNSFNIYSYFFGVDYVLGKADLVMPLRSFPGFYAFRFSKDGKSGFEEIHLVKRKQLYIIKREVRWHKELLMTDGFLKFEHKKILNNQQQKFLLKGIKSVVMKIVAAEKRVFSRGAFKMMQIVFMKDDGTKMQKYFWIGGDIGFSTDRDYIYQDNLDE